VPLRIIFCGTPAFAVPSLRHLAAQPDFKIEGVVTQPDRPRGRGGEIHTSPVKHAAIAAGIPVYQPEKIKSDEAYEYFRQIGPDAVVIIAYGQIISPRLIAIPRLGWINLHASLLPKYRGAAPINWAIVNGEKVTGLTTMQIDAGLDTGPILLQRDYDIGYEVTAEQVTFLFGTWGASVMVETLQGLDRGEIVPTPQDNSQATFAPPLKKEDGRIDWSQDARTIYNRVRGLEPWPGTFSSFHGKLCHIWGQPLSGEGAEIENVRLAAERERAVAGSLITLSREVFVRCGAESFLRLEFVRVEGRKRVTAREFAMGARIARDDRFGS
jgi:methionyl-tRNA formyltransferase